MIAIILQNVIELLKIVVKVLNEQQHADSGMLDIIERYDKIIKNLIIENESLKKQLESFKTEVANDKV